MSNRTLKPEDYLEPECVICDKPPGFEQPKEHIPQQRISQKLDELMGQKRYEEAERMLQYWQDEAVRFGDRQGLFMVFNEMMGYYRKRENQPKAYEAVRDALAMLDELGYRDSVSGATCYTNAATVYTAFGEPEKSLDLFEKAQKIYEENSSGNEYKLAGLYNNMAIALTATGRYEQAVAFYQKALDTLADVPLSQLEKAITCLNIIDVITSQNGVRVEDEPVVNEWLEKAQKYLDDEEVPRDSYYSFVADKCLDIYEFYGWFRYVQILKERIAGIDEGA